MEYIKNSTLVVKPTPSSVNFNIVPYLEQTPYSTGVVTKDTLHVNIFRSKTQIQDSDLRKDASYRATVVGCKQWFNHLTRSRNIILVLDSPDLVERHRELSEIYDSVFTKYLPHMTLAYDITHNAPRYRWWFNDLATVFNQGGRYHGHQIELVGEHTTDTIVHSPEKTDHGLRIDPNLAVVP